MKMTKAEYLKKRGWTTTNPAWRKEHNVKHIDWFDPLHVGAPSQEPGGELVAIGLETAVNVQLSRDGAEERRAFDGYFAALSTRPTGGGPLTINEIKGARDAACEMVNLRRAEFAVEFTD